MIRESTVSQPGGPSCCSEQRDPGKDKPAVRSTPSPFTRLFCHQPACARPAGIIAAPTDGPQHAVHHASWPPFRPGPARTHYRIPLSHRVRTHARTCICHRRLGRLRNTRPITPAASLHRETPHAHASPLDRHTPRGPVAA
jgi:hypothetical protein